MTTQDETIQATPTSLAKISSAPSLSVVVRDKIRYLDRTSELAGIQSLDLAGRPLNAEDLRVFISSLRIAIGSWTKTDESRAGVLFQHICDKGWSMEHLDSVLYRFSEKKLYGGKWSFGDFFECDLPDDLHPYAWVRAEVSAGHSMKEMEGFRIPVAGIPVADGAPANGVKAIGETGSIEAACGETVTLWRYTSNIALPFEHIPL